MNRLPARGPLRASSPPLPDGVDAALELVGCSVLADTLNAVRRHGTVCFTGALAGQWTIPDFTPFMIPGGVRLTSYGGQDADLPADVFARQFQAIAAGSIEVPVAKVYHCTAPTAAAPSPG